MRALSSLSLPLLALLCLHCASEDSTCYSPGQNLDQAYEAGAEGCECSEAEDPSVCVPDSFGRGVALVCKAGRWEAVEDGPCADLP